MTRRPLVIVLTTVLALGFGATSVLSQGAGKVAMLLPGSVNDQSWNAAGYAGLLKLKDKGMEIAYSENVQAADHVEAMKDYARRGFSPVIGHSGRFLSAAQRVGPEFGKATFLVGSGSGGQGNVISLDVANEQYAYVVGVLAGKMTKTGKVGAVAGLEGLPNMIASMGGFRLGVKSVKPDAEVKITPERVLTNIDEKWADIYASAVTDLQAGKLTGHYIPYGYNTPTGGAELRYSAERALNPVVPGPVAAELETVRKKIASGEIKIKPTKEDARGGV